MLLCAAVFVCAWACVRESLGDRKEDREAVRERMREVCLLTGQVNDSCGLNSETVLVQEGGRRLIYPLLTHRNTHITLFQCVCVHGLF